MSDQPSSELMTILKQYDLGELVGFRQDERGTVNTSFTIELQKGGLRGKYFFRRYKNNIRLEEIICEHSIIRHLKSQGFNIVAGVLPTREGSTFIERKKEESDQNGVFYAIFDFLTGEDRYTWIGPVCSDAEIDSAAAVLARFHHALFGFVPSGSRLEPRIMELLPVIEDILLQCAARPKGTPFDAYLVETLADIRENLHQTRQSLVTSLAGCPEVVIHCDYHPGNLKFEKNRVVGVFDLDWSKIDYRCFDVALAIFYFFVSWEADRDGQLRLQDVQRFLNAYQTYLAEGSGLSPLTPDELNFLPEMIAAANLYVLNWAILDYLRKDVDPDEYLIYLRHAVRTIQWLGDSSQRSSLLDLLRSAATGSQ